jgi:hypothetical protein
MARFVAAQPDLYWRGDNLFQAHREVLGRLNKGGRR